MCGGSPSTPAVPPMPTAPPPLPTPVDDSVINSAKEIKRRAASAGGYSGTIATSGQGVLTPAFTTGTAGFKALMGQ